MTGVAERIAQFAPEEEAPEGIVAKVLCRDHVGTYMLPFPACARMAHGLTSAHERLLMLK